MEIHVKWKLFLLPQLPHKQKNKHVPGMGEIAQWIKTLLHKHQYPSAHVQDWPGSVCLLCQQQVGTTGDRRIPGACRSACLTNWWAPIWERNSVSGNKGWLCMDVQPSYLCAHAYATHINTVKKQKKVSKCSPLFCSLGRYKVWDKFSTAWGPALSPQKRR